MTWQCWQLTYEVKSPLHIGYQTIGNIQRTRYYIPGKNFWGVATSRITLFLKLSDFQSTGEFVRDNIRFGYFYPALSPDKPLLPRFTDIGWEYGSASQDKFESDFISSFAGTAISSNTNSAEEGSLHEVEYIVPYHRRDKLPVLFTGHLFLKENATYQGKLFGWDNGDVILRDILNEFSIGGERRYGFGSLKLKDKDDKRIIDNRLWNGWEIKLDGDMPLLSTQKEKEPILAHCLAESVEADGNIEPLVGREWVNKETNSVYIGAGQKVARLGICWIPGSLLKNKTTIFKIGAFGIWLKQN